MKRIIGLAVFATLIFSCSTDIDTLAPWKDISVVYGLLDADSSEHYVKINKAFLGQVNANDVAANSPDSINYEVGEIEASVEAYEGSQLKQTYSLQRQVNTFPKQSGDFSTASNVVYHFSGSLNDNYTYRLVLDKKDGSQVVAATSLVTTPTLKRPSQTQLMGFANIDGDIIDFNVEVSTGKNSAKATAYIDFNYEDHLFNGSVVHRSIPMKLGASKIRTSGNEKVLIEAQGVLFFDAIKRGLSSDPNIVSRKAKSITTRVYFAGDELNTYMEVNNVSVVVPGQDKPVYSNLSDGRGVFSSRRTLTRTNGITSYTEDKLQSLGLGF